MRKMSIISLLSISTLLMASPKISNIELTNLNKLEKETVMDLLPIKVGQEYSNKLLSETYLSLIRSGLIYNVNIFPTQDKDNVSLKLVVDEMPEADKILQNIKYIEDLKKKTDYKVKNVKFVGTDINLDEIKSKTNLKEGEYFSSYDASLLRDLIMLSGYFSNVEVLINRNAQDKTIELEYHIKEYPRIRNVKIEGSTLFNEEQLVQLSGLKKGDILNVKLLNPQTSPLLKVYAENGFAWASFVDASANNEGDVYIKLNEGIISKVIYEKKNNAKDNERIEKADYTLKTKDFVLNRNIYIKKGDILNQKPLELTLRELFRTGLFTSLVPEIYQDPENPGQFIVKIVVTERPTTSISGNVSYSTEDGLSGSLKLADTNFLGREENFDFSLEASLKGNYNINLSFKDPWIEGTKRLLAGGSVFFRKNTVRVKDLDNYKELKEKMKKENISTENGLSEKQKDKLIDEKIAEGIYNKPTDKQYIFGMNGQIGKGLTKDLYLTASTKLMNVYSKSKAKEEKARVYQDYTLASVGTNLIFDTRDDRILPKKGLYLDLYVEGGYIFREKSLLFGEDGKPIVKGKKEEVKPDKDKKKEKNSEKPSSNGAINNGNTDSGTGNSDTTTPEGTSEATNGGTSGNGTNSTPTTPTSAPETPAVAETNTVVANAEPVKPKENEVAKEVEYERLKPRAYFTTTADLRAYHPIYKDKNSMAYRVLLNYSHKNTPANQMMSVGDGLTLRGLRTPIVQNEYVAVYSIENRTYLNNYLQTVLFLDGGIASNLRKDGKLKLTTNIGLGARINTPIGVVRLDYGWDLSEKVKGKHPGKFNFGFGHTF